jgi:hypothetical protein
MKIASTGNPSGYSGIGVAGLTMSVIVTEGGGESCRIVIELGPSLPPAELLMTLPEIPKRVGWIMVGSL